MFPVVGEDATAQLGCGPDCPLVVRPYWCRQVAQGIRLLSGCLRENEQSMVGRVRRADCCDNRRLQAKSVYVPGVVENIGPLPNEDPDEGQFLRAICDSVCDNDDRQAGGDMEWQDDGSTGAVAEETDGHSSFFGNGWCGNDFKECKCELCSSFAYLFGSDFSDGSDCMSYDLDLSKKEREVIDLTHDDS